MVKGTKAAKPKVRRGAKKLGKSLSKIATANTKLRTKIVARLVENPALTAEDMALELRISRQRAQAYMTEDLHKEAERVRLETDDPSLEDIDRAMRRQARLGNVQAARLVYMRVAQKGEIPALPTLDELEAELANLKKLERNKGETPDGEDLDAAVALVDAARG